MNEAERKALLFLSFSYNRVYLCRLTDQISHSDCSKINIIFSSILFFSSPFRLAYNYQSMNTSLDLLIDIVFIYLFINQISNQIDFREKNFFLLS
jgi:hypothetical protein